jgi:UDP-glucuronate 4-epimerase
VQPILLTGAAGFIGFHVTKALLESGLEVVGYDNLNDYYDVALKLERLRLLQQNARFHFVKADLIDKEALESVFAEYKPNYVINLAAQAGVRYSLVNPDAYIQSNVAGFLNILEACRHHKVSHLVYASSSSVYGANRKLPFSVDDNVDHPVSLYAATKKSGELMAHTYSHIFRLPTTGLRFFTVYGPWGRPDMALFTFAKAILARKPIDIYNFGNMYRDFTYIDDVVQGVIKVLFDIPKPNPTLMDIEKHPGSSIAPYRIFNIGNHQSVCLLKIVELLEQELGVSAIRNMLPIQDGDVEATFADIEAINKAVGYEPVTSIEAGIKSFVAWYKSYAAQHPS